MMPVDDDARLRQIATALADGIEEHLGPWIGRLMVERAGGRIDPHLVEQAVAEVVSVAMPSVRALLDTDIDRQRSTPLAVIRSSLGPATRALRIAGIEPIARDPFRESSFPDDEFDLSPTGFADIASELHEPGLTWGAAKAHVHLARRRAEGLR